MKNLAEIKQIIFNTVEFNGDFEIETYPCDKIEAVYENQKLRVGCNSIPELCRAISLTVMNIRDGKDSFKIDEKANFKQCGVSLDLSRNAVKTVEGMKEYINYMASMGLNTLLMYIEDIYEMPEYPYFGYMRGRYSREELKAIDDYAAFLGIEVIPAIQSLGHLEQYLKWPEPAEFAESRVSLLPDEEKTYVFLENCIRTMRESFRTNSIHLGMDEVPGLGRGRYLKIHGYHDQHEIFLRHLNRVCDICRKYGYERMIMYADCFFRFASNRNEYYDDECVITDEAKKRVPPDACLAYWDYYRDDKEHYELYMKRHEELGDSVAFWGAAWTWHGYLCDNKESFKNSIPALEVCIEHNTELVIMSTWGDEGTEADLFWSLGTAALYAEYCYKGKAATREGVAALLENCTGLNLDDLDTMSDFHNMDRMSYFGKAYLCCDPLINAWGIGTHEDYQQLADTADKIPVRTDKWDLYYKFAKQVCHVAAQKAKLIAELRPAYLNQDKAFLKKTADETLPAMLEDYKVLLDLQEKIWLQTNKGFGWEVLCARYGGVMARVEFTIRRINQYLNGEIAIIEELEAEPIPVSKFSPWADCRISVSQGMRW